MSEYPKFRLTNVRKTFDAFSLQIDAMEICRGEAFGLLGPTGSGKSTLLRLLAGLVQVDNGTIAFDDTVVSRGEYPLSERRRLAMVHQRPLMLKGSVRLNVEYGLRLRTARIDAKRVDRILDQLRLTGLANQSAQTLSGGQLQLVAIARALVLEPDVLLLDEPTANLDPAHVALAESAIVEMCADRQTTVVWATHHLFQVRRIAQKAGLLLNGRLIEIAPVQKFFERPNDLRTADFVQGRMIY